MFTFYLVLATKIFELKNVKRQNVNLLFILRKRGITSIKVFVLQDIYFGNFIVRESNLVLNTVHVAQKERLTFQLIHI